MRMRVRFQVVAMGKRVARLAASALILLSGIAIAAPEDFDVAFGDRGTRILADARTQVGTLRMTGDGGLLVLVEPSSGSPMQPGTIPGLWRLTPDGLPDPSFAGGDGFVSAEDLCMAPCAIVDAAASQDSVVVLLGDPVTYVNLAYANRVVRLAANGSPDATFGVGGSAAVPSGFEARRIATSTDGSMLLVGQVEDAGIGAYRLLPSGLPDASFGDGGVVPTGLDDNEVKAMLVTVTGQSRIAGGHAVAALRPNGTRDSAFGQSGLASFGGNFVPAALAMDATGRLVAVGDVMLPDSQSAPERRLAVAVLRTDGGIDTTFGDSGFRQIATGVPGEDGLGRAIAIDSAGRFVVAGIAGDLSYIPFFVQALRIVIARMLPDGTPDTRFAPAGSASFRVGYRTQSSHVVVQTSGRIVIAGTSDDKPTYEGKYPIYHPKAAVFALWGGSTVAPRPYPESKAVEYLHAGFGHYFLTSHLNEIRALDDSSLSEAWTRTGVEFNVWSQPDAQMLPVCRFWSDQSFAPKSSHFYTPFASECDLLVAGTVWKLEDSAAFALRMALPGPGASTGRCPEGSRPLYRAYNDGAGGAPNHRYMDDGGELDKMLQRGWIMEGYGTTRAFACIPGAPETARP